MNQKTFSPNTIFPILMLVICAAGCKPASQEATIAEEPKISGDSIQFPASSPTVQRIETVTVVAAHERVVELPGRIVWDEDHTSRLAPPVSGRFSESTIHGMLGAAVKANDTLAWLVSPDIGTAQSEFVAAQAADTQARKTEARVKELLEVKGVSAKDLEQAEGDLQRASAEVDRTRLRLKLLGVNEKVDQRFAVRSPIAGVIVERNTNPGMEWQSDQAEQAMFVVSDPTYLWCWINAPESVLSSLHSGVIVNVRSTAWPQEIFKAQIDYVSDALDPATHTLKVRAHLRNPDHHLKGEMYVTAELASEVSGALDVPSKAVFMNNNQQQVFVKTANGEFSRKTIVPVASNEQWVSVKEGLKQDDEVVVDGALYLEKLLEDAQALAPTTAAVPVPAKPSI
jgi:cobalt-zinc-cadmium efflux system membrane fusion protein